MIQKNQNKAQTGELLASVLPHNDAAEQIILGTIISTGNRVMEHVSQSANYMDFYQPHHAGLFRLLEQMNLAGKDINLANVQSEYLATDEGKKNPLFLMSLIDYNQLATLDENVAKVKDLHNRRKLWAICKKYETEALALNVGVDEVKEGLTDEVKSIDEADCSDLQPISVALKKVYDRITENMNNGTTRGLHTGFGAIDAKGGFQEGDLVVIAAESSQGKTSFALSIVNNAAKLGIPTAYYSLEMEQAQIAGRLMSADTGIPANHILNDNVEDEVSVLDKSIGRIMPMPIFLDDKSTSSVEKIYQSIRKAARRCGVKLVAIDYLQILSCNGIYQNQEIFYGEVARKCKNLAKDLGICIILLSQLSRCNDTTEPSLRRIRGSGQINEAADWTFTIYRPEVYNRNYTGQYSNVTPHGTALIKCEKGRNVGLFDFICGFNANSTNFYDLTETPQAPQEEYKPF